MTKTPEPATMSKKVQNLVFVALVFGLPIIELAVIMLVAHWLGTTATLLLVILTTVIGLLALAAEWRRLTSIPAEVERYRSEHGRKAELPVELESQYMATSVLFGVSALLLLVPGFVTDVLAYLLLLGFKREAVVNYFESVASEGRRRKRELELKQQLGEDAETPPASGS